MRRSEAIAKLTADLESLRAELLERDEIIRRMRARLNLDFDAGWPYGLRMRVGRIDEPARMTRPGKEKRKEDTDDGADD